MLAPRKAPLSPESARAVQQQIQGAVPSR